MFKSAIAGLKGKCIFSFIIKCQTIFQWLYDYTFPTAVYEWSINERQLNSNYWITSSCNLVENFYFKKLVTHFTNFTRVKYLSKIIHSRFVSNSKILEIIQISIKGGLLKLQSMCIMEYYSPVIKEWKCQWCTV